MATAPSDRTSITDIIPGAGPIHLRGGNARAVLLLHGFGDTPQTFVHLAPYLHEHGYDVRAPLLPGHGRSIAAIDASTHVEWLDYARAEFIAMRAHYRWVSIAGLSMGGTIAALLAAQVRDVPSLVLIAPYLTMPKYLRVLSSTAGLWSDRAGPIRASNTKSVLDPVERKANLAYGAVTGRGIHELSRLVNEAKRVLGEIRAPTLLIQSAQDNRVSSESARRAFAELRMESKRLVLTHEGGHIITVDYGRLHVFEEIRTWLGLVPEPRPSQGAQNS